MEKLLKIYFFFLLTTQICFGQWQISKIESQSDYPSSIFSNTSLNIDSLINITMTTYHLPGLSACIVRDGEIIWTGAYGYADIQNSRSVTDSTLFCVASLSKTFVCTALMQLWENGLFEFDEDINNHLPFQVRNPNHPNNPITFRMLLTHTSSIRDRMGLLNSLVSWGSDSPIPLDSFLVNYLVPGGAYWNNINYSSLAPQTSYDYSNVGAALLGYLVQSISNIPFEQYCQDSIFIPLGMNNTSWFLSHLDTNDIALPYYFSAGSYHSYGHYGFPDYPDGQLRTSAVQYARHLIALMQKGQIEGVRILDSSTVELITTIQFPSLNAQQALIWFIYPWTIPGFGSHTFCGHTGGYFGVNTASDYTIEIDNHVGVIVFANGGEVEGMNMIWDALYTYSSTIPTFVENDEATPSEYILSQNYPNPFNSSTIIKYSIPKSSLVTLKIFNTLGEEIETLVNEEKPVGNYEVNFNANTLPSGVYLYRLQAGDYVQTRKMILLK